MALTKVPKEFSTRYLNEGFSGGEKKRMEYPPARAARARSSRCSTRPTPGSTSTRSTPSPRASTPSPPDRHGHAGHHPLPAHPPLVQPEFVHIMFEGRIVKEGGPELVTAARGARATAGSATRLRRRWPQRHEPARAVGDRLPDAPPHRRRVPRLRRDLADPDPGDRGDGRLLPGVPGERPPRRLPDRRPGHGGLRGRADQGRRLRRARRPRAPSSPATRPRRSTSSPTPGAPPTSAPATCSSSRRWSTTRTSSRGTCWPSGPGRSSPTSASTTRA